MKTCDVSGAELEPRKFHDLAVYNLTKREYFAALAMQGYIDGTDFIDLKLHQETIARNAVEQADALIKALEAKPFDVNDETVAP